MKLNKTDWDNITSALYATAYKASTHGETQKFMKTFNKIEKDRERDGKSEGDYVVSEEVFNS